MGIRVLGTLHDLDLGSEGDLGGDLEAGALVCLPGRAVTHTAGEVGDMDTIGGLVLHFDGLLLGLDELHNVAQVVAESSAAWASRL